MPRGDYHTYPPVGRCIYCGATDCDLSKEHIIPYALNGNWVLPKASCVSCQKKTQKIEEVCTHERYAMFSPLRRKLKMQSRSRTMRRREFLAEVQGPLGDSDLLPFESDSFPAAAFGMRFPPAGILLGNEPSNRFEAEMLIRTSSPSASFRKQASLYHPFGKVKVGSFWPTAFLQLLAKIGYSFAAAELGTRDLLPMLADAILGKTDKSPYLVGGGGLRNDQPPPVVPSIIDDGKPRMEMKIDGQIIHPQRVDIANIRKPYGHSLNIHTLMIRDKVFTIVIVHLFGCMGMPQYHVVVGQRQSDQGRSLQNGLDAEGVELDIARPQIPPGDTLATARV